MTCDLTMVTFTQWMMCILSLLLRQQLEWIQGAAATPQQPASRDELTDQEWLNMDASFSSLLFTFHSRMKGLLRGWRSQKIDVELQIGTFAGGVFEGWYNAVSDVLARFGAISNFVVVQLSGRQYERVHQDSRARQRRL